MQITFEGRPTQFELFQTILASAQGLTPYRRIHSGGAIRGAKSFTNTLALLTLARTYPGSKWSVHRKDLTILETTTIETFSKILGNSPQWHWNRNRANFHLTHRPTGSRIFFVGANESRDRDFTDTLGLEINGAFFDQLEDVSQEYYNAVLQRVGSWHIENEPRPVVLTTFNPHPGWIKTELYKRFKSGSLPPDEVYFPLSPTGEPSNTEDQWAVWNKMPPDVRARMIEGDWESFENKNPFFFAFDRKRHVAETDIKWNPALPLYLSWDFNISPLTCIVGQFIEGHFIAIIKSYKIRNCTIKEMCNRIKADFPGAVFRVTADPAGGARSAGYESTSTTMHSIIIRELGISRNQFDTPLLNWSRADAWTEIRIFCNSILQNHPKIMISSNGAADLISDIELATTEEGKDKLYKTSGDTEYGCHLTDCFMYFLATWFNKYAKRKM